MKAKRSKICDLQSAILLLPYFADIIRNLMTEKPAHVGQRALGVAANGNQFCGDGNGNLFGCNSANIEAHGSMDPLEQLSRETFLLQLLVNSDRLTFGTNHADVAGLGLNGPA